MPTAVIAKVDKIGKKENQGKEFRFLNRNKGPFDWTDEIPDNDGEFQGLLGEEAHFPDISSELSGVILEDKLVGPTAAFASNAGSYSSLKAVVGPTSSSLSITPGSLELITGNEASSSRRP